MAERLKPSEQLEDLLSGRVSVADTSEAILSWARFSIYQAAVEIIGIDGKGNRRNALARIPAQIRPYVEREVKRLWK